MTAPLLHQELKDLKKTIITKTEITKTNNYKKEYSSFSDEKINNFNRNQLIDLIQRYHVYSQQYYVESKFSPLNIIQLKAEVVTYRDKIKASLHIDTSTSMEDTAIALTIDTSNKMIEQLTNKGAIATLEQHLISIEIGFDSAFFTSYTKHDLQTELKKKRNALIHEHQLATQSSTTTSHSNPVSAQQIQPSQSSNQPTSNQSTSPDSAVNSEIQSHTSHQQNTPTTDKWKQRVGNRNEININTLTPSNFKTSLRSDSAPNLDKQNQFQVRRVSI